VALSAPSWTTVWNRVVLGLGLLGFVGLVVHERLKTGGCTTSPSISTAR
jgi:hypothetical protein